MEREEEETFTSPSSTIAPLQEFPRPQNLGHAQSAPNGAMRVSDLSCVTPEKAAGCSQGVETKWASIRGKSSPIPRRGYQTPSKRPMIGALNVTPSRQILRPSTPGPDPSRREEYTKYLRNECDSLTLRVAELETQLQRKTRSVRPMTCDFGQQTLRCTESRQMLELVQWCDTLSTAYNKLRVIYNVLKSTNEQQNLEIAQLKSDKQELSVQLSMCFGPDGLTRRLQNRVNELEQLCFRLESERNKLSAAFASILHTRAATDTPSTMYNGNSSTNVPEAWGGLNTKTNSQQNLQPHSPAQYGANPLPPTRGPPAKFHSSYTSSPPFQHQDEWSGLPISQLTPSQAPSHEILGEHDSLKLPQTTKAQSKQQTQGQVQMHDLPATLSEQFYSQSTQPSNQWLSQRQTSPQFSAKHEILRLQRHLEVLQSQQRHEASHLQNPQQAIQQLHQLRLQIQELKRRQQKQQGQEQEQNHSLMKTQNTLGWSTKSSANIPTNLTFNSHQFAPPLEGSDPSFPTFASAEALSSSMGLTLGEKVLLDTTASKITSSIVQRRVSAAESELQDLHEVSR